jgi:DNA-directed RNA polymerase subunit RPC12/RpoP
MKMQIAHKTAVIKCPHCGAEYLPGEIYLPSSLIGQPDDIVKDGLGRILYEDYSSEDKEPNMTEHFVCEYCEKPFIIEATVTYKSMKEEPEKDFSTQYVSLLD